LNRDEIALEELKVLIAFGLIAGLAVLPQVHNLLVSFMNPPPPPRLVRGIEDLVEVAILETLTAYLVLVAIRVGLIPFEVTTLSGFLKRSSDGFFLLAVIFMVIGAVVLTVRLVSPAL
jgi:hypothetical protein